MSHFRDVEALIFDMGNVLIRFDHRQVSQELARLTGLSEEKVHELLFASGLEDRYEKGEISTEDLYREISSWSSRPLSIEDLVAAANCSFTPLQEVIDVLEPLSRHYRLCLLSNTNEVHWEFIATNYDVFQPFEAKILSFEVRAMKPDPKIYQAAVDALGLDPGVCLFTDDLSANITAAEQCGLRGLHFQSPQQFLNDMRAGGIRGL